MREILFRGKDAIDGKWIYGDVVHRDRYNDYVGIDRYVGGQFGYAIAQVKNESVSQYTGLTDKNGLAKIFEYDIIDANGRKVGNYYENSNLLKDGTCFLVARMGTKEWSRSEQEAIKRGCKYAE